MKWTSVEYELPPFDVEVLVVNMSSQRPETTIDVGVRWECYAEHGGDGWAEAHEYMQIEVTHWAPKPALPKVK